MIVEVIRGLNLGGAETLLYTRLRYAMAHRPRGFSQTVVVNTLGRSSFYHDKLTALGIRVISLSASDPIRGMFALRRVLHSMPSPVTAIFHSPATTYLEKLRRAVGFTSPGSLVDVVHSTQYRRSYQMLGAVLDRFADVAVAVSDDVAAAPTTAHYRDTKTILAGVDIEGMRDWIQRSSDAPSEFRKTLGIAHGRPLLVSVGSLIRLKGHRHVIAALADPRLTHVSFALIGDGPERASLQALARDLGVADRVRFVGKVPDGWKWTAIADVIVHPSDFEGLPVALMEAAALGTPIVATNVGGIGQIMEMGGLGMLLEKQDAAAVAGAVAQVLGGVSSIADVYIQRASAPSFWSMRRYASAFYSLVDDSV